MKIRAPIIVFVMAAGLGAPPVPVSAMADGAGNLRTSCHLDYQLFCSHVDPESHRSAIVECLVEHRAELTESCRAVVAPQDVPRGKPDENAVVSACRDEFARACGRSPDRWSYARCVRDHRSRFSRECQEALDKETGSKAPSAIPRGSRPSP